MLSAQGAQTAAGDYRELVVPAVVLAVALPLYYYRNRLVGWLRGKRVPAADRAD